MNDFTRFFRLILLALSFWTLSLGVSRASGTLCASVQLQISQQLTFERQGFNATMTINNGLPTTAVNDVVVSIYFTDAKGNRVTCTTDPNATSSTFFYQAVGTPASTVGGGQTLALQWQIIPSKGAGGLNGTKYFVGATLTYTVAGQQQAVTVVPAAIYVYPQPDLILDYFLPAQVYGADPTHPQSGQPIPFSLGVRVTNTGSGMVTNLQINSGQPCIIENTQGLAVQFVILGASINDAVASPSLLANFGTIGAGQSSVARWIMTSSLSGTFTFSANFTHADSLGGSATSFLTSPHYHSLVQDVLVDSAGKDAVRDFLVKEGDSFYTVYESQGIDTSVTDQSSQAALVATGSTYRFAIPGGNGFVYAQVGDPFSGQQAIRSMTRADGKQINLNNVWLSKTYANNQWNYYFNLFDVNNTEGLSYTVSFGANQMPPVFYPITDQILTIDQRFSLQVGAYDPTGVTAPVISSGSLPSGASLGTSNGGKATLTWTPTVGQSGNYPVSFVARIGNLSTTKTIRLTVSAGSKLQGWKEKYFPGITDPNIIGDTANPSGDGLSNLLKYALNLDPTKALPNSGILIGTIEVGGKNYLTLTYVGRTDDPTIQLTVVGANSPSASESQWVAQTQTVTISQDGVPSGMQRVEIQDSQPIENGSAQRFLKLRVTNNGN